MKHTHMIASAVIVLTLGLVSYAAAQMMGGNQGHMAMRQSDSLSHSATMGVQSMGTKTMGMTSGVDSLMTNMSMNNRMMTGDFDKLESHFNKMMQIQDMATLKAEMQKHQALLNQMRTDMNQRQNMFKQMMSMLHSNGNNYGMMGQSLPQSATASTHASNH